MAAATKGHMNQIMLPISEEEHDDVWVCINGKSTYIKRGVTVEVSDEVYEVLQNSMHMKQVALERSIALAKKGEGI